MNRLEMARAILQQTEQPVAVCPFLAAMPAEIRASLEQQHPNPHDLSEAQMLELTAQYGYEPQSQRSKSLEELQ